MFSAGAFSALPLASTSGFLYDGVVDESAAADAQAVVFVTVNPTVEESAGGSDEISSILTYLSRIFEGATAVTSKFLIGNTFNVTVPESAGGSDSISSVATYPSRIFEGVYVGIPREIGGGFSSGAFASGAFSALGDESRLVSGDLFIANIGAGTSFQDSARISETNRSFVAFATTVEGIAGAQDQTSGLFTASGFVSESGSGTDQNSSILTYLSHIQEQAEGVDETVAVATFAATIAENAVPLDVTFNKVVYEALASERATANDKPFSQLTVTIPITEAALITDPVTARKQWEPITTDEVVDWILVNTSKPN